MAAPRTNYDRAVAVMATGWCPWPYLRTPVPGDVKLDGKALCRCHKRVRVTARGLYAHHKMAWKVSIDEVRKHAR
jgi:hypothetical protein